MAFIQFLTKKIRAVSRKELVFLLVLMAVSSFLRFYRLEELYSFLGDQGRDVIIVRDILLLKNFPFVGPIASVGDFYLGPFYYYLIAPALLLSWFNPIGPAIFVSLTGVLTCFLLYFFLKNYASRRVAIIAAVLYVFSPVIVYQTRFSWNPNPVPFFLLMAFYFLLKWVKTKQAKFFYLSFVWLAFLWQLHYVALIILPVVVFFLFFQRALLKTKMLVKAGGILALSSLPLIVFDIKHGFTNLKGFFGFFQQNAGSGSAKTLYLSRFFSYTWDRWRIIHSEFFDVIDLSPEHKIFLVFSFLAFLWLLIKYIKQKDPLALLILLWAIVGTLTLSLFQGTLHVYYLLALLPLVPILFAIAADYVIGKIKITRYLLALVVFWLIFNFTKTNYNYLSQTGNLNIKTIEKAVNYIADKSVNEPFNFALLSENNYDSSYRYFFDIYQMPAEYTDKATGQLFVVCEELSNCHPEGNPKWEVAIFDAYYNGKIKKINEELINDAIKIIQLVPDEK